MNFTCTCGKQYRLPDDAAGKRARCKACGEVFTVPSPDAEYEAASTAPRAIPATRPIAQPADPPAAPVPSLSSAQRSRAGRVQRNFWLDALYSFTIFSKPANIGPLIGCAVLLFLSGVVGMIPIFGLLKMVAQLFLEGCVVAFFMDVVRTTAGGDDELPTTEIWGGYWENVFKPLFEFVGATALLMLPAIIVVIWKQSAGATPEEAKLWGWSLAAAGAFLWPMAILAISLGGLSTLLRVDLLILTILKTLPAYLTVLALMAGAVTLGVLIVGPMFGGSAADSWFEQPSFGTILAMQAFFSAAGAYVSIVCMRTIGLYYRHFSERFPWTAG